MKNIITSLVAFFSLILAIIPNNLGAQTVTPNFLWADNGQRGAGRFGQFMVNIPPTNVVVQFSTNLTDWEFVSPSDIWWGQNKTISTPVSGEPWTVGMKKTIRWNLPDYPEGSKIRVELGLVDGVIFNLSFRENVEGTLKNTGYFEVSLPYTFQNGDHFIVVSIMDGNRVKVDEHGNKLAWESEIFTIGVPPTSDHFFFSVPFGAEEKRFFRIAEIPKDELMVSTDASSPEYSLATAGSVNMTATVAKFRAPNGNNLTKIALQLTSGSPEDIVQATIWDGAMQVGSAIFTGTNKWALAVLPTPILVPKDTDKTLTVKVDLANIGIDGPVKESGHLVTVDIDTSKESMGLETKGVSVLTGETIKASGKTISAGLRVFKSYPTVALVPLPSTGIGDGRLMRFSITANACGPISIWKIPLGINIRNYDVNRIGLYGFTDPTYSQPISGFGAGGKLWNQSVIYTGGENYMEPYMEPLWCVRIDGSLSMLVIPAGTTVYFEVRGDTVLKGTTGGIISSLYPDTQMFPALGEFGDLDEVNYGFIWSPNSLTMSGFNDPDWTNGYGIPGLPGVAQERTN